MKRRPQATETRKGPPRARRIAAVARSEAERTKSPTPRAAQASAPASDVSVGAIRIQRRTPPAVAMPAIAHAHRARRVDTRAVPRPSPTSSAKAGRSGSMYTSRFIRNAERNAKPKRSQPSGAESEELAARRWRTTAGKRRNHGNVARASTPK